MLTAQQAWPAVLSQLQTEMPRPTFDTWVKGTRFLAFEDGVYQVGVVNEYARDWLDSRLNSTVARHLTGILNQSVDVRFVVDSDVESDQVEDNREDRAPVGEAMRVSIAQDLQDLFTRPDTALYFPAYWLRWVPYMGAGPFLTVLGLRQALYQRERCFQENLEFEVSTEEVGALIGLTRQTVSRYRDEGRLDWFLTHQKTHIYTHGADGTPNRQPFRYAFKQFPMTPGDIEDALNWLLAQGLDRDPLRALSAALEAQPNEILVFPLPRPTKVQLKRKPGSAHSDLLANVLSHCPSGMDGRTRAEVMRLTSELKTRLIDPKSVVRVPLYFLRHYVAWLGPAPAMAAIYLRSRAYNNPQTGEVRERVILHEGYAELARLLSMSEGKVREFMPLLAGQGDGRLQRSKASPEQEKRAAWVQQRRDRMSVIIREVSKTMGGEIRLLVKTIDHLHPDHQEEFETALRLVAFLLEQELEPAEISEFLDCLQAMADGTAGAENNPFRTNGNDPNVTIRDNPNRTIENGPFRTMGNGPNITMGNDPLRTRDLVEKWTKSNNIKVPFFKYLKPKALEQLVLQLITDLDTLNTNNHGTEGRRLVWVSNLPQSWTLPALCKTAHIGSKTRERLNANGATPQALVAQLVYAYGPEGNRLQKPLSYAIAQVLVPGDGGLGPGPAYDRVASLSPRDLQALIRGTSVREYSPKIVPAEGLKGSADWRQIMARLDDLRPLYELAELLGLLEIRLE